MRRAPAIILLSFLVAAAALGLYCLRALGPGGRDVSLGPLPLATDGGLAPHLLHAERRQVLRVVDGDTIVLAQGGGSETVRLIGVDTPESVDPRKPVEAYGIEASRFLTRLLQGQTVVLRQERPGHLDKYGRTLAHVHRASDGLWVNLEIVRQGFGQVYSGEAFEGIDEFLTEQRLARESGRGLWADGKPGRAAHAPSVPQAEPQIVFITRTGSVYHRKDCSHLKSSVQISVENARERYRPCSRCAPPL